MGYYMNIIIVEDQEATRNRLASLLTGQNDYSVMAAVDCAEKALELMVETPPDMIILDLGLPGLSGDKAIKAIKSLSPTVEILIFTVMAEDEQVFSALKAGATGYMLKDAQPLQIIEAIEEIKAGGSPMSFPIARKVLKEFQNFIIHDELLEVTSPLTSRETEVLELLYQGNNPTGVADRLFISPHTVSTHIKNIYRKLQVNSCTQAIFEACKMNFIKK